jgi:imidazolonepropionase-like amidohydrolase
MTAMAGFIDAHRHINTGPNEKQQMQALLEAGYTTILSGGGPAEGNITLRDHIEQGAINGPRIIPSGSIRLANVTVDSAREEIRKMAALGVKFTGEIADAVPARARKRSTSQAILDGRRWGSWSRSRREQSAMMAAVDAVCRCSCTCEQGLGEPRTRRSSPRPARRSSRRSASARPCWRVRERQ